ncbi:tetratricopeptide repeat protein [Ktedonobacter sp. SOSP1-52]|uniref:tetratricopeptide repeat protein n=1 Tax=Ktedonobacter sp. SOSP1-52 TaxID=2778366 RepID=UPI001915D242|nr:tetratricopeptide repeat protein [Ktedonobacter sp. SOSP1-52]GHO63923.1 tetratricopeptide repeat protein [Ktedonobacter sp. SOSP1-52]
MSAFDQRNQCIQGNQYNAEQQYFVTYHQPAAPLSARREDLTLPIWHIPFHRNPFFIGREAILSELHTHLKPHTASTPTFSSHAISGLGGIGKTQIAIEYAYRFCNSYDAILWLQVDSPEHLTSSCIKLAFTLNLPEHNEADVEQVIETVRRWLASHSKWLLILDNVEDLNLAEQFLPPGHTGSVLLTTSAQVTEPLAQAHQLDILSEQEGVLFLLYRSGVLPRAGTPEQADPKERLLAKALWEIVEGLPLALEQIGAYIRSSGCNFAHYYTLYVEHRRHYDLLQKPKRFSTLHPASIVTTLTLAFAHVQANNPAAMSLLHICALVHPKKIPEELFLQKQAYLYHNLSSVITDPLKLDEALETLQSYSLILRDPQEKTLSLHRLVHMIAFEMQEKTQQQQYNDTIITILDLLFPNEGHSAWRQCERLLPHVLTCLDETRTTDHLDRTQSLLTKVISYLQQRARYREAIALAQRLLTLLEHTLGTDHPFVAQTLNGLADLYRLQGNYRDAESLYQRAWHIGENISGGLPLPFMVTLLNNWAIVYRIQRKQQEAEQLFRRAFTLLKHARGSDRSLIPYPLQGLAHIYHEQGKYKEAERLYRSAIRIWNRTPGPNALSIASTLTDLATLYSQQGAPEQAEPLYLQALHLWEQANASDHPDAATTFTSLANLYKRQQRYQEAEPLYTHALELRQQILGAEHPHLAYPLVGLANLLLEQEQFEQAQPYYQRALELLEHSFDPYHLEIAYPLMGLAMCSQQQGKYMEAQLLYQRGLAIRQQHLGSKHPDTQHIQEMYTRLLQAMAYDGKAQISDSHRES